MKHPVTDRDMLETWEGFFFTVVGHVHPPDRYFAYLKYLPTKKNDVGIWKKGNVHFQRVIPEYSVETVLNTFQFLENHHPEYLFSCPVNNIQMSAVPRDRIKKWYHSHCEYQRLLRVKKRDPLEEKVVGLATELMDHFYLKREDLGITGSVALQIHHSCYSDIDLIIFGRKPAQLLSTRLPSFLSARRSFQPLPQQEKEKIIQHKAKLFGISKEATQDLINRKWNMGMFYGTRFALLPVRKPEELDEKYGDRIYHAIGSATIIAKVIEARDAVFNPAVYGISVQKFLEGLDVPNLRVILSWENFFANAAQVGERILAKGKLERVEDLKKNEIWHRLVIGSAAKETEYILPYKR
jgi:predicted nucleotidyltransferase